LKAAIAAKMPLRGAGANAFFHAKKNRWTKKVAPAACWTLSRAKALPLTRRLKKSRHRRARGATGI